ncbi:Variable outer membrane protein [Borrelia duttonii CR2A]|uniref:Variable outer membrane protein n=1 Tax=Borrelia duttonii CR2A TaxID=1432657 RepID=W6TVT3_9SPIR|nr:Variable outer membrane protein [Borrelia duttonii CR2A]
MKREGKEGEIKGKREIEREIEREREAKRMNIEKKGEGKIRVIILMMVMMGCNSGGRDPEKVFLSEMVNLGKGFLDVFVSFGDMITGTLGDKSRD